MANNDEPTGSGVNTILIVLLIIIVLVAAFFLFGGNDLLDRGDTDDNSASVDVNLPDLNNDDTGGTGSDSATQ